MPRPLRIEYEGALYHVMSRGDRREGNFLEGADRDGFLCTLGEACAKTAWQVHAYCLMSNHFHLVVESSQPNLALGMKWFLCDRRGSELTIDIRLTIGQCERYAPSPSGSSMSETG